MTNVTKDNCIEKVCNLPIDFILADKSIMTLIEESKFLKFCNDIFLEDIKDYLSRNRNLIANWETWSEGKRTLGNYLSISSDAYSVGSLDKNGKENFSKLFSTAEEACAEFILREIRAILGFNNG
jgi:hypothetical protein